MRTRQLIMVVIVAIVGVATLSVCANAAEKPVIGVSVPVLANPFWQRYIGFVEVVAKQLEVDIKIVDCQNNEAQQVMDIENLIAAGVNGLIVTPQTAQVGPTIIQRAEKAGVPIAVTDRWPGIDPRDHAWDGFVGFIGPDDEDAGYNIAKTLIVELGKKNIAAINGVHGASVAEGRYAGLAKGMKEFTGATLVDVQWIGETPDLGIQVMENYLAAHAGKIDGVWCYNDSLAVGAVKAAKDAGLTDKLQDRSLAVVGMDLNPDAVELIKEGSYYASFGGHWLQGGFGLIMLYDYLNGQPPKPEYRVARLKLMKVSKDLVAPFKEQFIDKPPSIDARKISKALNPEASGKYFFEIAIK
jgi:simple sugar transport system substrate-binding protein/ribose transport system substrate-binding protein